MRLARARRAILLRYAKLILRKNPTVLPSNGWITLSTQYISIQWITQLVSLLHIRWIVIYPLQRYPAFTQPSGV